MARLGNTGLPEYRRQFRIAGGFIAMVRVDCDTPPTYFSRHMKGRSGRDDMLPPEEEEPRGWHWLIVLSRVVSGLIFLAGFVWSARHFTGGELMMSFILMLLPMAMIWYPKEVDEFGKGGYGEGGAPQIVLAVFGWVCLFVYLAYVSLRVKGYL